jgi:hypothetical protein
MLILSKQCANFAGGELIDVLSRSRDERVKIADSPGQTILFLHCVSFKKYWDENQKWAVNISDM